MKKILTTIALFLTTYAPAFGTEGQTMNEIRTYMPFTYPVDPVKIQIIPDMDMSYALASTLVEWDSEKQISAGLAESWKIVAPNVYRFTLRKNAAWSDGKPLSSTDVKASFERSMRIYPDDLRSLIQMIDTIECVSDREIDFKLRVAANESGLLGKLTEPNYGVLKVNEGNLDLSITTGPFYLDSQSDRQQLTLLRNGNWHRFSEGIAERVLIRRSPNKVDAQTVLLSDSWPNLIETSSLINAATLGQYESENYELWKRPLDKFFYMNLGKRSVTNEGRALIRFLRQKLNAKDVVAGLSGYTIASQVFPRGYQLHSLDFSYPQTTESLPDRFKAKPLEILISPARVSPALQENIRRVITAVTGVEPRFISVPLEEVRTHMVRGDYDLYAGTIGLADPDPEGVMSFYLEGNAPMIASIGNDFLARLDAARKEKTAEVKLGKMRQILCDALLEGYVMPLFHLSTVGIGRGELDFSGIPTSDESVTLSKVRFRRGKK